MRAALESAALFSRVGAFDSFIDRSAQQDTVRALRPGAVEGSGQREPAPAVTASLASSKSATA